MGNVDQRQYLWTLLEAYASAWPDESPTVHRFREFTQTHNNCFDRACIPGHITGSALVASPDLSRVLLTHHRKLNMWIQLGGHADGEPYPHLVALKEAEEESGLKPHFAESLTHGDGTPRPLDLDVHLIPARKADPDHFHYDVRYLLVADDNVPFTVTDESHDLRWLTVEEAKTLTQESSMLRMFDKLQAMIQE